MHYSTRLPCRIQNDNEMKKLALYVLLLGAACFGSAPQSLMAQAKPAENPANWGIKFYGFVRNDIMYDSRQIVSAREGDLSLYAKDKSQDANGKDINAAPTFHMLAITSRLGGTISGPDAFGAKTSAILEAEFFGNIEPISMNSACVTPGPNWTGPKHSWLSGSSGTPCLSPIVFPVW